MFKPQGTGLFGQPAQTQGQQPASSIFGQQPQNSAPALNTNLFGGGAAAPAPNTGSIFGNPAGSGNPLMGGLNTSTQPQPTGSLFGQSQAPTQPTGLFGQPQTQPPTGLFGQPQQQQQQGAPATSLFGQPQTQGSTAPTTSLFGQPAQQQSAQGSSLFGQPAPAPTTSLFGQPQAPTTSLFGQPAPAPTTGSIFGNTPGGGLFGQQNQGVANNNQNQSTSLFGSSTANQSTSLFGNSTANKPTGSIFGNGNQQQQNGQQQRQQQQQQNNSTLGMSAFGAPTLPGLGGIQNGGGSVLGMSRMNSTMSSVRQTPTEEFAQLQARIEGLSLAWNPQSPACAFQHYFYNLVDPNQVHMYGRPSNAIDTEAWDRAVRENPDRGCLVPVLAVGFDDLEQRVNAQAQQAAGHQEKLAELRKRVSALAERHSLSNAARVQRAHAAQTQTMHRLLKLIQHLHFMIPSVRNTVGGEEEEGLARALEEMSSEVGWGAQQNGKNRGRLGAKVNELWALVGAVAAARERNGTPGEDGGEWAVVDEEGLGKIAQILKEQQAGLAHLTKILQKDLKDLAVITGTEERR